MLCQVAAVSKAATARRTGKGLLPTVDTHMLRQVSIDSKVFSTLGALKLARVRMYSSDVGLAVAVFGKTLPTVLA